MPRKLSWWIENPLAQAILSGEFMPGDNINADISDEKLVFTATRGTD
jgi:ATP-dependent Clp protease ATP-binding subunit ClpB